MNLDAAEPQQDKYSNRVRPLVAWRALQALFRDKEDTGQVFKIIEALKGNALEKTLARLEQTDNGQKLLSEKPSLLSLLNDREKLAAMPEGSLGRAYLHFIQSEDLSAEGLVAASQEAPRRDGRDDNLTYLGNRLRDSHDLYHVLTGYGRDGLGELCLLKYSNQHSYNRGIAFIVLMASRRNRKNMPDVNTHGCLREAKANARSADWLVGQPWEELLPLPLEEVRSRLHVLPPKVYQAVKPGYLETVGKLMAMAAEQQRQAA